MGAYGSGLYGAGPYGGTPPALEITWVAIRLDSFGAPAALLATATTNTGIRVAASATLSATTSATTTCGVSTTAQCSAVSSSTVLIPVRAALLATSVISTGNYRATVLTDAPAGYWRLAEISGSVAVDSSSHGVNGAYVSGINQNQPGMFVADPHSSTLFNGVSGDITVPLPNADVYSMEAWVQSPGATWPVTSASNMMVLTPFTGGDQLEVGSISGQTGRANFTVNILPSGQDVVQDGIMSVNTPHHMVGTYDGLIITLYVDGLDVAGKIHNGTLVGTSGLGHIGNSIGLSAFFSGFIQDVAFYPYRLSAAQVMGHYLSGKATGSIGVSATAALIAQASTTTITAAGGVTATLSAIATIPTVTVASFSSSFGAIATTTTRVGLKCSDALIATTTLIPVGLVSCSTALSANASLTTTQAVAASATASSTALMVAITTNFVVAGAALLATTTLVTNVMVRAAGASNAQANINTISGPTGFVALSAAESLTTTGGVITLVPISDPTLTTVTIFMTGPPGVNWTTDTNFQTVDTGTSESGTSITVTSTTTATWVLTTGPGVGTISISDGVFFGLLLVNAGGPASLSASTSTNNGPSAVAASASLLATSVCSIVTSATNSATCSASVTSTSGVAVAARGSASASVALTNQTPIAGSVSLSATTAMGILLVQVAAISAISAISTTNTAQAVAAAGTASASTSSANIVGFAAALSAMVTSATKQAVAVAQACSALATMVPVPSGIVPANAALIGTATIISSQILTNATTISCNANTTTANTLSVDESISSVTQLTILDTPTTTCSLSAITALSTTQIIVITPTLFAFATMASSQTGTQSVAMQAVASLGIVTSGVVFKDGRPLAFTVVVATDAISATAALQAVTVLNLVFASHGQSSLLANASMQSSIGFGAQLHAIATLLGNTTATRSVTMSAITAIHSIRDNLVVGDAALNAHAILITAYPFHWFGIRTVIRPQADVRHARAAIPAFQQSRSTDIRRARATN